jgi:hypothetical protein
MDNTFVRFVTSPAQNDALPIVATNVGTGIPLPLCATRFGNGTGAFVPCVG